MDRLAHHVVGATSRDLIGHLTGQIEGLGAMIPVAIFSEGEIEGGGFPIR